MRPHSRIAVVCAMAMALGGCSEPQHIDLGPLDDPRRGGLAQMREVSAKKLCELVPAKRVRKVFARQLETGEPSRSTDRFLGKIVDVGCTFYAKKMMRDSVDVSIRYHYTSDNLETYLLLETSHEDELEIQEIDGLADAALFAPEGSDPEPSWEGSELIALTEFDNGIRRVSIVVGGGAGLDEMRPVVEDLLAALDKQPD